MRYFPTPRPFRTRPSPCRGGFAGARSHSRTTPSRAARHITPRCHETKNQRPRRKAKGAERRQAHLPLAASYGCRSAFGGMRSPLGAPPRLSFRRPNATTQLRAALPDSRCKRALGPLHRHVQPDTWQTGRHAGRVDARSRPGADCKSARRRRTRSAFRSAFRKAPFGERADRHITISVTNVNENATMTLPTCAHATASAFGRQKGLRLSLV